MPLDSSRHLWLGTDELFLHRVIDDANKFIKNYIKKFNKKFSIKPKGSPIFRGPGKKVILSVI